MKPRRKILKEKKKKKTPERKSLKNKKWGSPTNKIPSIHQRNQKYTNSNELKNRQFLSQLLGILLAPPMSRIVNLLSPHQTPETP